LKSKTNKSFSSKCRESFLLGNLITFSEYLYSKAADSLFVKLLTDHDTSSERFGSGMFGKLIETFHKTDASRIKMKMAFASYVENSFLINLYRRLITFILDAGISLYGNTVFAFGFLSSVVYIVKRYLLLDQDVKLSGLAAGIALMLFSIPLLLSKSHFRVALGESFFGAYVLQGMFGFLPTDFKPMAEHNKCGALFMLFGASLGLLTFYIPCEYIVIAVIALSLLPCIMHKPEFGFMLLAFALPFLPTMVLAGLLILVIASFFFKVLRGKRTFKFDICDTFVLFFITLMMLGGIVSSNASKSIEPALLYVCFMLSYFLAANLIRSTKQLRHTVKLLVLSLLITSVYGLYQNFFGTAFAGWHDEEMFSDIATRVISTFENPNVFGEYLILLIPVVISLMFIKNDPKSKVAWLAVLICSCGSLIYTWSRGAWLGFIIAMFIYLLVMYKHTIALCILGLFSFPFMIPFLPESIVNRFTSIGNLNDTSTNYRVNIWKAVVKMIEDTFITGIGVGEGAFDEIYPYYSLSGIESAPHSHNLYLQITLETGLIGLIVFIIAIFFIIRQCFTAVKKVADIHNEGAMLSDDYKRLTYLTVGMICGIIAFLVMGFTDYVWYNYRVFLMFWIMCGVAVASARSVRAELCPVKY